MLKNSKTIRKRGLVLTVLLCCMAVLAMVFTGCSAARGISSASINEQGELFVTYTDGSTQTLGTVVGLNGEKGDAGTGITSALINEEGELVVTYTDGSSVNLGVVVGEDGQDGADGAPGKDGVDGEDGAPGKDGVDGEDGAPGKDGVDGEDGAPGKDGVDGEDGAPGKDGADGVGIESILINEEGKMEITYTDGKVAVVDLPDTHVDCAHENTERLVFEEHTKDQLGVYLYVCRDCGYTTVRHEAQHDYEVTYFAPTCTQPGYNAKLCLICGIEEEQELTGEPALGHAFDEGHYVVEEGRTICEDGGMTVRVCERCGETAVETTEPVGHHSAAWEVTKTPTLTAPGTLKGICENCGSYVTHELPAFNETDYTYTVTAEKELCTDEGEAEYAVTVDGQTFTFPVRLEAKNHVLNGTDASKLINADGTYSVSVPGIVEFRDEQATCTENGRGYYVCEACHTMVYVETHKGHILDESTVEVVEPTCQQEGSKSGYCVDCQTPINEVLEKIPHTYHSTLQKEENGTFTIINTCTMCGDEQKETGLTDVSTSVTEATCTSEGSIVYTYTDDAGQSVTLTVTTPKADHRLNGKASGEWIKDGRFNADIPGIMEFMEWQSTCETEGKGWYQCEACGIMVYVTTYRDHRFESFTVTKEPTCTEEGTRTGYCTMCGTDVEESIAPLGHSFTYELEKTGDNTFRLSADCSVCGEHQEKDNLQNVKQEVLREATCTTPGLVRYTYTDAGTAQTVTLEVETARTSHILNGKPADQLADEEGRLDISIAGVQEFPDEQATCTEAGKGWFVCEECEDLVYVDTWKGHRYDPAQATVKVAATCTEEGVREFSCTDCGETHTEPIPALGHDLHWNVTQLPDGELTGTVEVTCERCDAACTVDLPALTDPSYQVESTDPTCSVEGVARYTISVTTSLGDGFDQTLTVRFERVLKAQGHEAQAPQGAPVYTWEDDGIRYTGYICDDCGQMIVISTETIESEVPAEPVPTPAA